MTKVAIVHHSITGLPSLAEAIAKGATAAGASAEVYAVDAPYLLARLSEADAIVFGCPTYMGSASASFKAFMDSTHPIWAVQGWRDKLGAAFTLSDAPSGDMLATLTQLALFAAHHGMVWIGPSTAGATDTRRLGSQLGATAEARSDGALPESDVRTAELLGERIATAAKRWSTTSSSNGAGRKAGVSDDTPNDGASRKADANDDATSGETTNDDYIVSVEPERHPAAQYWAFPPLGREPPPPGVERTNLRELAARPSRFEHHLVVVASIGTAQLELAAASEPLCFAHINCSDEVVVALPTGDDLADRFPLRTFLARPDGSDAGRYNHRNGDAVLHPQGWLHWPGRLRAPYTTFDFPPGMRRSGLSVVYCASVLTRGRASIREAPDGREEDVKVYTEPAPPMILSELRVASRLGAIGKTQLDLVVGPREITLSRGGFVVVLEAAAEGPAFASDLYRLDPGAKLDGAGIVRALVFSSGTEAPDAIASSWNAVPESPGFAPFEDAPPGALPFESGNLHVSEAKDGRVKVVLGDLEGSRVSTSTVPRYWLARMLFRVGLHGYRLGYVETYEGFFVDDRGSGPIRIGLRGEAESTSIEIPRAEAPAVLERLYRAVAPAGYVERLR